MKIKNCILVNGEQSISVVCSQSKGTASFKYYGIKPLPGHFPDGDEINTDIHGDDVGGPSYANYHRDKEGK